MGIVVTCVEILSVVFEVVSFAEELAGVVVCVTIGRPSLDTEAEVVSIVLCSSCVREVCVEGTCSFVDDGGAMLDVSWEYDSGWSDG